MICLDQIEFGPEDTKEYKIKGYVFSPCFIPLPHAQCGGIDIEQPKKITPIIIRGCGSAVLSVCNMIELVHAKLTHTYAATRRLSGMPVSCATVMLSVFQICWSLLKKAGVLDSPENM